jgi:hypothetical protein
LPKKSTSRSSENGQSQLLKFAEKVREACFDLRWDQTILKDKSQLSRNTVGKVWRGDSGNATSREYIKKAIDTAYQKEFEHAFSWTNKNKIETSSFNINKSLVAFIKTSTQAYLASKANPRDNIIKEVRNAKPRSLFDKSQSSANERTKKLLLNKKSLAKFIKNSPLVSRIDQAIAVGNKLRLISPDSYIEFYLERISHVGLKTISEIERHLKEREQTIKNFAISCNKNPMLQQPYLPHGVCIASLQVLLLLEKGSVKALKDFLVEHRINKRANPHKMTRALKAAYDEAQK